MGIFLINKIKISSIWGQTKHHHPDFLLMCRLFALTLPLNQYLKYFVLVGAYRFIK
jgi:hypothetical protein